MSRASPQLSDDSRAVPDGPSGPREGTTWLRSLGRAVISVPALAGWLLLVTVLASGPLHGLDRALNRPWSRFILHDLRPFFVHVVDSITDPSVAMFVVAIVSLSVAWQGRTLRPLVITAGAVSTETALVVAMKIITARPRPMSGNPSFFDGGLAESATIYPSGHAANAILIYGVAAYLISRYTPAGSRTARLLWCGVALIAVVASLTSLYLQWHWATDLIGGLVLGGFVLRATVRLDRTYPTGVWTPFRPLLWRLELLTWRMTSSVSRHLPADAPWGRTTEDGSETKPRRGRRFRADTHYWPNAERTATVPTNQPAGRHYRASRRGIPRKAE